MTVSGAVLAGNPGVVPNITPIAPPSSLPTVAGLGSGSGTTTCQFFSMGEIGVFDITFFKDATAGTGTADITVALPAAYPIRTGALTSLLENAVGFGVYRNSASQWIPLTVNTDGSLFYFRIGGTANMRGQDLIANIGRFSCKIFIPLTALIGQAAVSQGAGLATAVKVGLVTNLIKPTAITETDVSTNSGLTLPVGSVPAANNKYEMTNNRVTLWLTFNSFSITAGQTFSFFITPAIPRPLSTFSSTCVVYDASGSIPSACEILITSAGLVTVVKTGGPFTGGTNNCTFRAQLSWPIV